MINPLLTSDCGQGKLTDTTILHASSYGGTSRVWQKTISQLMGSTSLAEHSRQWEYEADIQSCNLAICK